MATLTRYWHTLRYLKAVQFYGRLRKALCKPRPDVSPAPGPRAVTGKWAQCASRPPSMTGPAEFLLLNTPVALSSPSDWNDRGKNRLLLYNLHYFDDLNARGAKSRSAWHRRLLDRWIAENPPGYGAGWEPYPVSLRIVNWIKWFLAGNPPERAWLDSLATQARWLSRRTEWHLLGNHLLANAKALVFAGSYFSGPEADAWLAAGADILKEQLPEQVLPDGGHFERSPMYHSLVLEDVLDLLNLYGAYGFTGLSGDLRAAAGRMRRWLACMCHPDGEISFFNDAAAGVACAPAELDQYALRLGLGDLESPKPGLTALQPSGYIRLEAGGAVAILDVAPVGPDYIPGHAHADTLSFELSVRGARVAVNSGVSEYGTGPARLEQRGTAAHNTVTVDGRDSSETWGGFRVARRARPVGLSWEEAGGAVTVKCAHDGYARLPGKPRHSREWRLAGNRLAVTDRVEGPHGEAVARIHLHPGVRPELAGAAGTLSLPDGTAVRFRAPEGAPRLAESRYHPDFGRSVPNKCIEILLNGGKAACELDWS